MGIAACCARPMGTLTGRVVFSDTHMSRQKTDSILFRRCGGETLRGFYTLPFRHGNDLGVFRIYTEMTSLVVPNVPQYMWYLYPNA